ncbi:Spo0B C-terminal domain-containing protein [Bacillus xiapuensis]|uniref:Spo0B C-terminal domain-containing protein n=1 Tax=Bacillus xiapuensis TaxID=2014075 RepID=UPI000C24BB1F|nr:Spo0B C-terminal domain-containing protein [Bacillus xiapuensis]
MENRNWTVIRAIRHARHDWMNQIQLIKGFMALGKVEEAERAIETAIVQARQEAHLCNLCLPNFAELILTFNWEGHSFELEYEILDQNCTIAVNDEKLTEWMASLLGAIEKHIAQFADNRLYLSINQEANGVRFFFEFSGIITDEGSLTMELVQLLKAPHVKRGKIHSHTGEDMRFEAVV